MKNISVFLVLFFLVAFSSFAQNKQVRNVGSFDAIKAGGSFNYYIEKGSKEKVVIHADDGSIDHIITEVNGGTLNIYTENNSWRDLGFRNVKVYITFVEINELHGSGSGNVHLTSPIKATNLAVSSSGSGNFYCDASITSRGSARISNSGSGNVKIENAITVNGEVKITNSGSGNLYINRLQSSENNINNSGSGDFEIDNGETGYQKIVMSGSGNVKMSGLRSTDCHITKSGSGSAYLHVEDELSGNSSGSGNIYLARSSARLDIRTSGSGKVKTLN